jgi:hypothetical protein
MGKVRRGKAVNTRKGTRMSMRSKLEAIKSLERRGRVDPDDLIEAARDPEHPCHNDFTWDTEAAAREYQREQARAIIRRFHFEVRVESIGSVNVVCYVPDGNSPGQMRSTASVRSQDDVAALFQTELRQLLGVAARVLGIAEAKRGVLGDNAANSIRSVCDTLKAVMVAASEPETATAAAEAA